MRAAGKQSVDFDTRAEADTAADTLTKQMKAEVVDVVKVAGLSTVVLKTEDVETIHVDEVPY